MAQGFITSFDVRRGTGFVQQARDADRIPFTVDSSAEEVHLGDEVKFAVVGGKAGLMAKNVRLVQREY